MRIRSSKLAADGVRPMMFHAGTSTNILIGRYGLYRRVFPESVEPSGYAGETAIAGGAAGRNLIIPSGTNRRLP